MVKINIFVFVVPIKNGLTHNVWFILFYTQQFFNKFVPLKNKYDKRHSTFV